MRWRAGIVAGAAVLAMAPLPAPIIERWYTNGVYPPVQSLITAASNRVPFALFDVLAVAAVAWYMWRVASDMRARQRLGWLRVALRAAGRLLTSAAVLYLLFLACWGLNYRRTALSRRMVFDETNISADRARELALVAASRANALYGRAHASDAHAAPLDTSSLAAAFAIAERDLGMRHLARPARPKRTLFDPYFRIAAVDGMTDPYFLETLVVSDFLPFERPFVVAHEWGHLAGFADESEANFVAWLACVHGVDAEQYSGWLFLYNEIAGGLRRADAREVSARLEAGPRADLRAVAERIRRHEKPAVSEAGWRVYDRYLKANRVEAGTASYAQMVRLILGTKFDDSWNPRLK